MNQRTQIVFEHHFDQTLATLNLCSLSNGKRLCEFESPDRTSNVRIYELQMRATELNLMPSVLYMHVSETHVMFKACAHTSDVFLCLNMACVYMFSISATLCDAAKHKMHFSHIPKMVKMRARAA